MTTEVVHKQRIIKWIDGKPVPVDREIISKEAIAQLPATALSLPYKRTDLEIELGIDEDFDGMTNGEVMMVVMANDAARGNHKAADMLLDRILGKPKMTTENKNLNISYEQYLQSIVDSDDS